MWNSDEAEKWGWWELTLKEWNRIEDVRAWTVPSDTQM